MKRNIKLISRNMVLILLMLGKFLNLQC
ncbi:hypothetical protein CY0110_16382 [Crocosphaera chwakensis CCY0110]|uniref:Uncharacterized protein n=1 Tax=Crocosphaera chwakensis CCY0110 TaxID=391612 RepID=A3IHV8_9CHRO|nr:hypothetical protein CY0110_16382 [Crocosphaera chwakensis CCY0110]